MLATAAEGPLDSPELAYEVKWDGIRVLVGVRGERVELLTRNGIECAARFPELSAVCSRLRRPDALLDGEVLRLEQGRPSFWALQRRLHTTDSRRIAALAREEPCVLMLFDILRRGDEPLTGRPWQERRRILEEEVEAEARVQLSPVWPSGEKLWEVASRLELEGVLAKRRSGLYHPGKRTADWLKIKVHHTLDTVVVGWTEGAGERRGLPGALLLALNTPAGLIGVGHVGTGFDRRALAEALALLQPLEVPRCPLPETPRTNARAHWVRPERVCEVRHQGWSAGGKLRAPVFLRWRPDKSPEECRASVGASHAD